MRRAGESSGGCFLTSRANETKESDSAVGDLEPRQTPGGSSHVNGLRIPLLINQVESCKVLPKWMVHTEQIKISPDTGARLDEQVRNFQ